MPTTTQINQTVYRKTFTPILEQGKDILYICFSSGLSSTWQGSCLRLGNWKKNSPAVGFSVWTPAAPAPVKEFW